MQTPRTDLEIGRKCEAFFAKGDHLPDLFAIRKIADTDVNAKNKLEHFSHINSPHR
jgi:hypothetical protein